MRHHKPDPYENCCNRCGMSDLVLSIWPGLPCRRRIASRYERRVETLRRCAVNLMAGTHTRWSRTGTARLKVQAQREHGLQRLRELVTFVHEATDQLIAEARAGGIHVQQLN